MKRIIQRSAGALILLFALFSLPSCSTIKSLFAGSAKKMAEVEKTWTGEQYARAISDAVAILDKDADFVKAKEFIRTNYETAEKKTREQIAAADSLSPVEKTKLRFSLTVDLNNMYINVKSVVPLVGPKDAWTWAPQSIPDISSEIDKAREAVVLTYLDESRKLLNENKASDARTLIRGIFGSYLRTTNTDSDAKKALRTRATNEMVKHVVAYGSVAARAQTTADLEEGFKTLDLVSEYIPNNAEVESTRSKLEARIADVYIAEGKVLEAKGDLASLKEALKKYKDGLKKVKNNAALNAAVNAVGIKIADQYIVQGYEKEKLGDEENLKAAIKLYEEGLKYAPMYPKVIAAVINAKTIGAEPYYKEAREAEAKMGQDPAKGKQVIALYKKAQEWIEDYKDTNQRIAAVQAATTVKVFVVSASNIHNVKKLEQTVAQDIARRSGNMYTVMTSEQSDGRLLPNIAKNPAALAAASKALDAKYIVVIDANLSNFLNNVNTKQRTISLNYAIPLSGSIIELTDNQYKTVVASEAFLKGKAAAAKAQNWRDYGKATATVTIEERSSKVDFVITYRVYRPGNSSELFKTTGIETRPGTSHNVTKDIVVSPASVRPLIASRFPDSRSTGASSMADWQRAFETNNNWNLTNAAKSRTAEVYKAIAADLAK